MYFHELGMCIDIMKIWFWMANLPISSILELSTQYMSIFSLQDDNLSQYQWIFTKPGMCIDITGIWFGIANRQISSIFDRAICPRQVRILASRR